VNGVGESSIVASGQSAVLREGPGLTAMMGFPLRRALYGFVLLGGLAATVAPRHTLAVAAQPWLWGFENAGEPEPKAWYVRAVRAVGVGTVAAGGAGLLLDGRAEAFAAADDGQYHHRRNRVGRARRVVSHLYTVQEYLCTVAEETRS
jgi:hypothetical protein